jgi:hypothetical protein
LAQYGVVLIPPTSGTYFEMLADVERRLQARPKGSPPVGNDALSRISEHDTAGSAILVNRAQVAIASIAYVWSFGNPNGRINTSGRSPGTNPSVLLPFGLNDRSAKFNSYWNTIYPGSKRLLTADGGQYGDNRDVRPPAADELWTGGFISAGGGRRDQGEPLKLTLDGVFFVDGGFAGPNQLGTWDQVVAAREAYLACAALAREGGETLAGQDNFFAQMQQMSGLTGNEPRIGSMLPPPRPVHSRLGADRDSIRTYHQQRVSRSALMMREHSGAGAAIAAIAAWQNTPGPEPHRL